MARIMTGGTRGEAQWRAGEKGPKATEPLLAHRCLLSSCCVPSTTLQTGDFCDGSQGFWSAIQRRPQAVRWTPTHAVLCPGSCSHACWHVPDADMLNPKALVVNDGPSAHSARTGAGWLSLGQSVLLGPGPVPLTRSLVTDITLAGASARGYGWWPADPQLYSMTARQRVALT